MCEYLSKLRGTVRDAAKSLVENAMCFMVASSELPLSFTESEGLRCYTSAILVAAHAFGPKYMDVLELVPSRKVLTERVLPDCVKQMKAQLRAQWKETTMRYHLTSDGWSAEHARAGGERFVSVTLHFLDKDWVLHAHSLAGRAVEGAHGALVLSSFIDAVLVEYELPAAGLSCVVTDNAKNALGAVRNSGAISVRCACHTLNLVVESSLKAILPVSPRTDGDEPIGDVLEDTADEAVSLPVDVTSGVCFGVIIKKVRHAVTRYQQSKLLQAAFGGAQRQSELSPQLAQFADEKKQQVPLTLISDVRTRWNSTYRMLERFTKLRETVEAVLTVDGPVLSRMEWTAVKMLVDVLKPFNDASEKLSGSSYATISMFLPVMASLATLPDPSFTFEEEDVTMVSDEEASDLLTALKALSASLRSGIRGRLKAMPLETTQFLLEAAFLDPRQKSLWFLQRACQDSAVLSDILPAVERGTIGTSAGGATGAALLERVMKSLKTQLTRSLRDAASVTDGAGVEGGDPACDFPPPSKIRRGTAGTIFSGIASSATSGSAS
jgi:hypothetical protein